MSEEHKRKISEHNRKNMLGRKASKETKQKMSESRKGKIFYSNNMVLTKELAFEIKTRLVNGEKATDISKSMNIDYKLINNIIANDTWASVDVDGWEHFRNTRKTYHRLTKEEHQEIYRLHIENGYNKKQLARMYNRTEKTIEWIFRTQRNNK